MKSLFGTAWRPPQRAVLVPRRWLSRKTSSARQLPARDGEPIHPKHLLHLLKPANPDLRRPQFVMKRNYQLFQSLAESRFNHVIESMGNWAENQEEWRSFGLNSQLDLERQAGLFKATLAKAFELAMTKNKIGRQDNPLFWNLRNAFIRLESEGLARELQHAFQTFLMRDRFPQAVNELHRALADMRHPYEWYPATRMIQRTIHLHVGPTNSGKTYNALKALENARTGIYAGPLRLLAHEVWNRFTAKNKACALVTGEEMRIPSNADTWFHSCTVEMTPLNARVDVAVIDEIQMIETEDRGWAWTQAFLGVQAKEVHLCGEERAVPLIQDLCARIGEKCVVHRYQRLNPLVVSEESLGGGFANLRKGDAVVAFSRVGIHQLKAGIEKQTGRRCAVVYGSLPPETRASQAALFNDPNNEYDFLAASDAIGMGLNLEIKRVIFESAFKFDGHAFRPLKVPEIKQIGGRAGRYRTATQEMMGVSAKPVPGEVTAFDDEDLDIIQKAFKTEPGPIPTAGLFPPPSIIERFHSYFPPRTPMSFVLGRLRELSRISNRFHMCDFTTAMEIAEVIKGYNLSVSDRCIFVNVPINLRDEKQIAALQAFANCVAELGNGHLLDFGLIDLEVLDAVRPEGRPEQANYLRRLESLHQIITMYLWLSYRYQGVFQSQALAFKVKEMVEAKITEHLEKLNFVPELQRVKRQRMRKAAARIKEQEAFWLGENGEEAGAEQGEAGEGEQGARVLEPDDEPAGQLVDARA
ncbi:P-loop containing nucleoside triphosphate hydrolase protein [Achaetomium macrosporum]|uniref:RNA helicase n=1 Tax=Achaetomium macrosporum TaxID=79813 RepID=A0AAN7CBR1_9PEZI|nr:P-loop containing nucleoside triphosphate hydrolase protein [Achaetomium macrosporum]